MQRLIAIIGLLLLASAAPSARADAGLVPNPQPDNLGTALFVEGLLVLNAGMASADPHIYGGILVLVTPLAFAETRTRHVGDYVVTSGALILAAHDMSVYSPDYDRKKVFRDNLLAWHLLAGAGLLADWLGRDTAAGKAAEHLSFTPIRSGGLEMEYRWTF